MGRKASPKKVYVYKRIQFDQNNPTDCKAYAFLEKIRYDQSKFVVRLVNQYLENNNITEETSYDKIRIICKQYIKSGEYPLLPNTQSTSNEEIKQMLMELIKAAKLEITTANTTDEIKSNSNSNITTVEDEDEEENEMININKLTAGFQSMAES